MSSQPEEILVQVARAVDIGRLGDRPGARAELMRIWEVVGPAGDALHRCAVAHAMADVSDDPEDELEWDGRALDAVAGLTDHRVREAGVAPSAAAFYPSLYLNLADIHRRLGDLEATRRHLDLGREALPALDDDGYRGVIAAAMDRVEQQLSDLDRGSGR